MVGHLLAPPLLGYAGQQPDGGPAVAACTNPGLYDRKFGEERPYDDLSVCGGEGGRERYDLCG
jgi:hypothetical protein